MPDYDYICTKCGKDFIVRKSMTDESTPNCLHCGSEQVKRVWGGIQLKGCCDSSGGSSGGGCGPCSGGNCSSCK